MCQVSTALVLILPGNETRDNYRFLFCLFVCFLPYYSLARSDADARGRGYVGHVAVM